MKKFLVYTALLFLMISCERTSNSDDYNYVAKIVGYDLNCRTCIVAFPEDLVKVKSLLGESQDNYYQAVNMSKDDFEIGQRVKVNIRKAETGDIKACITQYPGFDYMNIYITGCEKYNFLTFNEKITLPYHECLYDKENRAYLCFDSVLTDSRCPRGVECFWAGEARVQFRLEKQNREPVLFTLGPGLETTLEGYNIKMIDLLPYPVFGEERHMEDYRAELIVKRE